MTSIWASRQKVILGLVLLLSLLGWTCFRMTRRLATEPYIDFQAFYLAADAARTGHDPYRAGTEMYIYLPMLAAWMTPLTKLTLIQAAWVWFGLSLAATLFSLALVWKSIRERFDWQTAPGAGLLALGFTLLIWQTQCRWEFEQGQTDWLMLTGLCVALYFLDRSPLVVGMALGFAINIKYLPIVVVLYLAARGRWKCVAWSAVGTIAWGLAPALVYGWDNNLIYLGQAMAGLGKLVGIEVAGQAGYVFPITYDRSITIPSLWARVAETWGYSMAFTAGMTLLSSLVIAAIGWGIYRLQRATLFVDRGGVLELASPQRVWVLLEYLCIMVLMVILSPQAQMRHFFLLLPVVLTASALVVCGSTKQIKLLALAGLVIGVVGSIGADIFSVFGNREVWKYLSGASLCTLLLACLTLYAGLREAWCQVMLKRVQQPESDKMRMAA